MQADQLAGLDDVEMIDVREPAEFQAGRIEGAILIPLQTIPARLHDLPKDKKIVVICKVGARSAQAAMFLKAQGFDVENLEGGMKAWVKAGLPFTTPEGQPGSLA